MRNDATRIAIGFDAGESSPGFCGILSKELCRTGCDVVLIGRVPTPVLYHMVYTGSVDSGVMITGSHNLDKIEKQVVTFVNNLLRN